MNKTDLGKQTELLVCTFLQEKGYKVIARNYFCRVGEIDIIAVKDSVICAVEVKKFPDTWDIADIQYKIPHAKQLRIKKSMTCYLAQCDDNKYDEIRFDVAAVSSNGIQYWEGAF